MLIGEIIFDRYFYVEALGKAGKDPILTFKKLKSDTYPGGSLAIANNLSNFCKKIDIISYLGKDGSELIRSTGNLNKKINILKYLKKHSPTLLKTRYIDKDSQKK